MYEATRYCLLSLFLNLTRIMLSVFCVYIYCFEAKLRHLLGKQCQVTMIQCFRWGFFETFLNLQRFLKRFLQQYFLEL